ncbi:hypothetical protein [Sporosarcina sp. G11-34]|uniref:hypothetical protein n=1 Tax=Sporosarcina sp. G11-34 TaxID=2849605 RepID=UPI0022A9D281|nr:hypothetical protein [Sporosarcina sp. G11-34]MCZ2259984.1 hypothetical protein [Sporosarcina sp. G11-34]
MKKKFIVIGVVLLFVGVWGYTSVSQSNTDIQVGETWELNSKQLQNISFNKVSQNIKTEIKESDNEITTITLSGKVSEKTKTALATSVLTEDSAAINFSKKGEVKLFVTSEGKDELTLSVNLAKDATFKEMNFAMDVGSVVINLPESFDGKYETKAEGDGEVSVPETGESMDSLIQVKTIGNIEINK